MNCENCINYSPVIRQSTVSDLVEFLMTLPVRKDWHIFFDHAPNGGDIRLNAVNDIHHQTEKLCFYIKDGE